MKKLITLSLLAALALMSSGCMPKPNPEKMGQRMFDKYDENGDGFISEREYIEVTTLRFEKLDANGDNKVTLEEAMESRIGTFMPGIARHWVETNDLNGDGVVTRDEMIQHSSAQFKVIDTNNDEMLSAEEMKADFKNQIFDYVDTNKDGVVTRDEFQASKSLFEK